MKSGALDTNLNGETLEELVRSIQQTPDTLHAGKYGRLSLGGVGDTFRVDISGVRLAETVTQAFDSHRKLVAITLELLYRTRVHGKV